MIKSNFSIKILKLIFNKIAKQLGKMFYNKKTFRASTSITNEILAGENDAVKKNSYELTNPQVR